MKERIFYILLYIFHNFLVINCGYPPIGDEVQAGSVLLPASRRGRYLANIVRRQAVDGTGIKFNKDADRMNAEAKKKVDVLSEELLPYIIAEQERRTTLYKRVMTAIQNGEKGVTIAEIRNKPPAIIRKGLMYRCPINRAPKEPDGSGVIMCEDNIEPTPIMYESCLSAEDKELYVAENKYFFCNRHKIEGPDLPRNGTTVIGCAPCERTSLNYTSAKCALEDTDDVVVHYRYYPDRTYKFVTELDPDREVCDHWNPCQVGYIFSLPSPDQATPASELWHDYVPLDEEFEAEEIVKGVPEDSNTEHVKPPLYYTLWKHRIPVPPGYAYNGVGRHAPNRKMKRLSSRIKSRRQGIEKLEHIDIVYEELDRFVKIGLDFTPLKKSDLTTYFVIFESKTEKGKYKYEEFADLQRGVAKVSPVVGEIVPGQKMSVTSVNITCPTCKISGVVLRAIDGTVKNMEQRKYRLIKISDDVSTLQMDFEDYTGVGDFGDYFAILETENGAEERVKVLTITAFEIDHVNVLKLTRLKASAASGAHFDQSIKYGCEDCEILDIMCNGETVLPAGRVNIVPQNKVININFPSFDDSNACVYTATFKKDERIYRKIVAILENSADSITIEPKDLQVEPPTESEQFEQVITYKCSDCTITKVLLNGLTLITPTRRTGNVGAIPFFVVNEQTIAVRFTEYVPLLEGFVKAVFEENGEQITKNLMEIGPKVDENGGDTDGGDATTEGETSESDSEAPSTEAGGDGSESPEATTAGGDEPASDAASDATPDAASDAPADATTEGGGEAPTEAARRKA